MSPEQLVKQYKDKVIKKDNVQIHKITNSLVDVFQGDGWRTCSRYRKMKGTWTHLSDPRLAASDFAVLTGL
jgi:hypothetical protein